MNIHIFTGGIFHDFAGMAGVLATIARDAGHSVSTSESVRVCTQALDRGEVDVLVVCALRWTMEQNEKYAPHRERWATRLDSDARASIERFVMTGGGLMVLHSGVICFDDWAQWPRIVGGAWEWGRSSHPPHGSVRVVMPNAHHALAAGVSDFDSVDEVYRGLSLRDDIDVVAVAKATTDTSYTPVAWTHSYGHGKVFCDVLGHDPAAMLVGPHRRLLHNGLEWLESRTHAREQRSINTCAT